MTWQLILAVVVVGVIGFVFVVWPACVVSGRISDLEERTPGNEADNAD